VIVGIFIAAWLSYVVYRVKRYDDIEASAA
jgi:hypothetical protein